MEWIWHQESDTLEMKLIGKSEKSDFKFIIRKQGDKSYRMSIYKGGVFLGTAWDKDLQILQNLSLDLASRLYEIHRGKLNDNL